MFTDQNLIFLDRRDRIDPSTLELSPSERSHLSRLTHPGRREEFLRGRYALKQLIPELRSDRGEQGELLLPPGLTGSISHTCGHVTAFVAKRSIGLSAGIDLEIPDRVGLHLAPKVLTPYEIKLWGPNPFFLALAFSVKESVFKCLFPVLKKTFSFDAVTITEWNEDSGRFKIETKLNLPEHRSLTTGYSLRGSSSGDLIFSWCLFS